MINSDSFQDVLKEVPRRRIDITTVGRLQDLLHWAVAVCQIIIVVPFSLSLASFLLLPLLLEPSLKIVLLALAIGCLFGSTPIKSQIDVWAILIGVLLLIAIAVPAATTLMHDFDQIAFLFSILALLACPAILAAYASLRLLFLFRHTVQSLTLEPVTLRSFGHFVLMDFLRGAFLLMAIVSLQFVAGGNEGQALLAIAVYLLWRFARRVFARRADNLLRASEQAPVVFLRQFAADKLDCVRLWSPGRAVVELALSPVGFFLPLPLPRRFYFKRLEEVASGVVSRRAPFVAIGDPRERLPELGAARAYRSNATWQQTVLQWIDKAETIILVAAPSHGLQWEFEQIAMGGFLQKTIVLVGPSASPFKDSGVPLPIVAKILGDFDKQSARYLLAATFAQGRVTLIESRGRRESDYASALRVALKITNSTSL